MRILFMLGLVLTLSGCMRIDEVVDTNHKQSENKEPEIIEEDKTQKSTTCTNEEETLVFDATGDHLNRMEHTFYMSFKELGIKKDMDKKTMEKSINDSLQKSYGSIDGVSVSGQLKKNKVEIQVIIDYDQANIDQLIEEGLIHEGEKGTEYISFDKTVADYQESGYACK